MKRPIDLCVSSLNAKTAPLALRFVEARRSGEFTIGEIADALAVAFSSEGDVSGGTVLEFALERAMGYTFEDRCQDARVLRERIKEAIKG